MVKQKKRLLIVDDSEIDRETLKNIVSIDFDVYEAKNGYNALEILMKRKSSIDGVILDISMPYMDGFQVLRLMEENKVKNIPIVLITAEATRENVAKAAQYNVSDLIKKPFDAEYIIAKLRSLFHIENTDEEVIVKKSLSEKELSETNAYIKKLTSIYGTYIKNHDGDYLPYNRVVELMSILLAEYAMESNNTDLDRAHRDIIAAASQFYDIGKMIVPDDVIKLQKDDAIMHEADSKIYQNHTVFGADLIWLNSIPSCRYFVKICSDMCMHHHEHYDGTGFPHGLVGDENNIYTQLCSLVIHFDEVFYGLDEYDEGSFSFAIQELICDSGWHNPENVALLNGCESKIINYYNRYRKNIEGNETQSVAQNNE